MELHPSRAARIEEAKNAVRRFPAQSFADKIEHWHHEDFNFDAFYEAIICGFVKGRAFLHSGRYDYPLYRGLRGFFLGPIPTKEQLAAVLLRATADPPEDDDSMGNNPVPAFVPREGGGIKATRALWARGEDISLEVVQDINYLLAVHAAAAVAAGQDAPPASVDDIIKFLDEAETKGDSVFEEIQTVEQVFALILRRLFEAALTKE